MDRFSPLYGANTAYMEDLFASFRQNPDSVPAEWRTFFGSVEQGYDLVAKAKGGAAAAVAPVAGGASVAQSRVSQLIQAYRLHGHRYAKLDPLKLQTPPATDELQLSAFGLSPEHLNEHFVTDGVLPAEKAPLKDIIAALQNTYTGTTGVQLQTVPSPQERRWLKQRMEQVQNNPTYAKQEKLRLLNDVMRADAFERFIHTKYVGMKRFSVEGGDSLLPMMHTLVEASARHGVETVVMGMAHRGRLNMMVNVLHKPLLEMFAAFNDTVQKEDSDLSSGDVKYHYGKSYDVTTADGKKVHLSLLNNPSHLEAVNPLVEGNVRARQHKLGAEGAKKVLPLLIHGDSAFAGQGVVPETLNLANLKGYSTGGTVHVVINNQVGFTTNPEDTFSGEYCTDIARMLQVPIFHVNGDDVEACNHVMELAAEWRAEFRKDVVIDLVCYRRFGHNEGDDPTFTQPVMYKAIKNHPTPYQLYRSQLLQEGSVTEADVSALEETYRKELQTAFDAAAKAPLKVKTDAFEGVWKNYTETQEKEPNTTVSKTTLKAIAQSLTTYPRGIHPNPKISSLLEKRSESLIAGTMDWGTAENAAYAALLAEGVNIRLAGQDVRRGTFTHRHIGVFDAESGALHYPISAVAKPGTSLEVWNSPLSELAVLGFEYGYSLAAPDTLTIWEAQFGDFANGAQVMFDQFIASSEQKWHRYSGMTVFLPNGMEGQGPEHSSARIERFLQLCAEENMTVANPTTPAQIFHLIRRQALRTMRKPLIVATPKSLLRHPKAVSTAADLTGGRFETVLDDATVQNAENIKRLVLCSGKVYYDLAARKEAEKRADVALVRVEQLYPLPAKELSAVFAKYAQAKDLVWAQEEPRNQGPWTYILDNLSIATGASLRYIGRPASASPAVGSPKRHAAEQQAIADEVFA